MNFIKTSAEATYIKMTKDKTVRVNPRNLVKAGNITSNFKVRMDRQVIRVFMAEQTIRKVWKATMTTKPLLITIGHRFIHSER
jgi:hypothetical protein